MVTVAPKHNSIPHQICRNKDVTIAGVISLHVSVTLVSICESANFLSGRRYLHAPSWSLNAAGNLSCGKRGSTMWTRWTCVAAMCLGMAPSAEAAGRSGLVHRASCTVVRFYVAKFSASAAETWARSHGATEAEIEAARHCLKDAPAQTAQAAQ
jgi:hypothetical protein